MVEEQIIDRIFLLFYLTFLFVNKCYFNRSSRKSSDLFYYLQIKQFYK